MRHLIRTALFEALILLIASSLLAANHSTRPVSFNHKKFLASAKKVNADLRLSKNAFNSGRKICSCQILNLESANYQHQNVAVFAEKTNRGYMSVDFGIAKRRIEKEKKHMKLLFFDKLTVVDHLSETTDCKSLFIRLKSTDHALVMYDIIDADIRK